MNPLNLALRFLLELAALGGLGLWGWSLSQGWTRFVLAIAVPLVAAVAWGTFAVPDDPSRGGVPVVAVPGWVRLGLEGAFFAASVWAFHQVGRTEIGVGLGVLVVVHYALSTSRIAWMLAR